MPRPIMETILVDLDGTLVDPASGMVASCLAALEALGEPLPAPETLHWIIGPPLRTSFAKLLGGHERVEGALGHYRARYSTTGLYDATPYDGIFEAIESLKRNNRRLFICTSKPTPFATTVAEHFQLHGHFENIYGSHLDGRFDDKGDLIAHILETERLEADGTCMVGDRMHDIAAAQRNGLKSVGVLWGYGGEAELTGAGATALCASPCDLATVIETVIDAVDKDSG